MKNLRQAKKGMSATSGLTMGLGAVFILGVGLGIVNQVIADGNYTGLTALVLSFIPVVIAASYMYGVAKQSGMIKG